MKKSVKNLIDNGALFSEKDIVDENIVKHYQSLLEAIERPITEEEAKALMVLFNNDSSFGLAWILLGHIESADWSLHDRIEYIESIREKLGVNATWVELIRTRAKNSLDKEQ